MSLVQAILRAWRSGDGGLTSALPCCCGCIEPARRPEPVRHPDHDMLRDAAAADRPSLSGERQL